MNCYTMIEEGGLVFSVGCKCTLEINYKNVTTGHLKHVKREANTRFKGIFYHMYENYDELKYN